MNLKTLIAFLGAAQLATGCVVVGGRNSTPPPVPGDVTFLWSFAGDTCADHPEIKSVIVEIPGDSLQNGGVFPCTANNIPGITLHDFAPGPYDYRLTAVSYSNESLFGAEGTFAINGDTRVTADLTPFGGPASYAYLNWRFPPNSAAEDPKCNQAGVAFMDISIDGAQAVRFACNAGFGANSVKTPFLSPGTHSIALTAVADDGYPYYRYTGSLQTFSGNPISAEYRLDWAVGGASISWYLSNGPVAQTCGSAGISSMYINFKDSSGAWVFGASGVEYPCNASAPYFAYLLPGTYRVYIQANGAGGSFYASNDVSPPVLVISRADFDGAMSVDVYRQ